MRRRARSLARQQPCNSLALPAPALPRGYPPPYSADNGNRLLNNSSRLQLIYRLQSSSLWWAGEDAVTVGITEQMAQELTRDRLTLMPASTADRVAELLRTRIMEGLFPPGTRLSEEVIGQALGVSRNTLREAFRLLCHERLAVHQMHRGIFVPVLT